MAGKILVCMMIVVLAGTVFEAQAEKTVEISNSAYRLTVSDSGRQIRVVLYDKAMDLVWSDVPYLYRAELAKDKGSVSYTSLESPSVTRQGDSVRIEATLAGLELIQVFDLPQNKPIMEEQITLRNKSDSLVKLTSFEAGFLRRVTNQLGEVLPEFADERLDAIPFRHGATDEKGYVNSFSISDVLANGAKKPGIKNSITRFGPIASKYHISEGWAWKRGGHTLGIFVFNQENMSYSVITPQQSAEGMSLRFGGACMIPGWGEPSALGRIEPGQSVNLGVIRYQTFGEDHNSVLYGFREMLDERGCHFPSGFNPPVHWEELYDNPEWLGVSTPGKPRESRFEIRKFSYSKVLMEEEAVKAKEYSCESLYLDPGWDVKFGSFVWGEWLGGCRDFVGEMKSKYGLGVSLHCPLATWMSNYNRNNSLSDRASDLWPGESFRANSKGQIIEHSVCLGSKQYLDLAEKRLLKLCKDGVTFLMFDGNIWNKGCWNPDHGHPVPYTMEDHIRASLDLCQRIHAKYPKVLIEMHDMIAGGARIRSTPVYYKYGLQGSYDENWGFELMWNPMDDIKTGRATALYYYNMGCNVPAYLHVDLRGDNENCLVLWWYASTCRHLGIGGTHSDTLIAWKQKEAMKKYRSLERFYKHGEFYGINEEIHLHVLPKENAVVVNMFNLSDKARTISGSISVERLGIDPNRWYMSDGGRGSGFSKGVLSVKYVMAPWSSKVVVFKAL